MGKKTYIAGPMRGLPNFNYDAFNSMASKLREAGREVVNPAENFGGSQDLPWHVYMIRDVKQIVTECDTVLFLDGWQDSEGAMIEHLAGSVMEHRLTDQYGMPIQPDRYYTGQAKALVYGDRNNAYGHPREDFGRTAEMWRELFGVEFTPEDVALAMAAVKISRQVNKMKEDNLIDLCGYLFCYRRITEE